MTPADFYNNVAVPNVAALGSDIGNTRLAINAILTLDALMGVIHADRHSRGLEGPNDSAFRNKIAAQHFEVRLVRDAAFAIKHGEALMPEYFIRQINPPSKSDCAHSGLNAEDVGS